MSRTSKTYKVLTANPKEDHRKNITVSGGGGASVPVPLHRFALVGKGDQICFGSSSSKKVFVVSGDKGEPDIPLSPSFSVVASISVGKEKFELRIGELSTESDMRALEFLEQFHYRTNHSLREKSPSDAKKNGPSSVGGRRAILYAAVKIGESWQPAAYIDLQMPLMMCKPRHDLFNHPYHHPRRAIAWERWGQQAMKKHLNRIVRIARIVVSPELRGIGITRRVIKAAKDFALERWHIGGKRPVFMEISAEMLAHIDFVSASGFTLVGKTEGNVGRVIKDMEQMKRGRNGDFGIMTLQRKYFRILEDYCENNDLPLEQGMEALKKKIERKENPQNPAEWAVVHSIIREPIPYYLCPLDDYSKAYLQGALKEAPPCEKPKTARDAFSAKGTQISIENLSIRATYSIPESRSTRIIMEAFGLRGDTVYADIVSDVSVKASNGNIILVVGASGSGKSVFLSSLDPNTALSANLTVSPIGQLKYSAGWLRPLREDIPIFEALAEKFTPQRSFIALSRVGLSEALVFIKPFWMLSRGQQYRAMLADLLLRDEEVWLLDEFCTDLDPITAKIVAHNLRKQVVTTGRIAFIAAANHAHYLDALRPTRVLMLRPGAGVAWLTYKEYQDEFLVQAG